MNKVNYAEVWNKRGSLSYIYKNEEFYTIGPVPHYYQRRKKLLAFIDQFLEPYNKEESGQTLLDFGCGDGYYLDYVMKKFPNLKLYGCDLSGSMLERAAKKVDGRAELCIADGVIPFGLNFNIIMAIGVLGVIIEDNRVKALMKDVCNHLSPAGRFITFDAVATIRRGTDKWTRRTAEWYAQSGLEAGLILEKKYMIAYPLYERFHKYIGRHIKARNENKTGYSGIELNENWLFLRTVELMIALSPVFPFSLIPVKEGNCVFVFRKQGGEK